ncbi:hypothetical protein ACFWPQ_51390, partial [Streptomyces sp. NPDC058464]
MDYCSSCRRHLNGALACPGCGAYAPVAPRVTVAPATTGAAVRRAPADTTWFYDPDTYAEEAAEDPYDGPGPVPSAPLGRAARRRQRARWKKNQRRAVVATAVALVGGGLTVASLDRQGTDRAQAATAPDNRTMGLADEQATDATQAAVPTGRHRAPDATTATGAATANTQRARTTGARHAAPTSGQDSAASPQPGAASAAQPQSAATASTDTVAATAAATAAPTASATT